MGPVGSGKSSLLAAILAELEKSSGSVACSHFDQGFGYVSQTPWLQRGTIRENILFGEPLDTERYRSVVEACDLMPDLNKLPRHDHTFVGEGGSTLSGGQKARICLARAVYQNNLVYLLDDILSSVDPHVANHIFTRCISGILKEKTRIVCTHQHKFAAQADIVILLQNGKIEKQGPPSEVLPDYSELIAKSEGTNLESSTDFLEPETDILEAIDNNASEEEERSVDNYRSLILYLYFFLGSVEVQVYTLYFVSIGLCLMFFIFSSIVLMQVSRNLVDWWLAFWVSNEHSNGTIPTFGSEFTMISGASYYMNVYIFLGILNSVFTLLRAFLFAYGGVIGAKRIHKTLLDSVVMAKVAFFDSSPLGRILNRFSSDMYTIDDTLPFILNILLAQLFGLLGLLVMTLYGLPWLCLILVPIVPVYFWLQNHYRLTSRELKRLSSVTLSPVYNHFNETIQGLSTIRAFKSTSRFNHDNVCFLEANQKTQLSSSAASQWLGIWLQLIGVVMISGIGMLAILQHHLDIANPGLIGLAISYALSLTGSLGGVVNAFTETEREMVAVERVRQYYSDREGGPEREYFKYTMSPPFGWPSQGVVSFNNVYVKYRNHLPYALHNVTFSTRPSEKVGIVGRTGAGKSSLISAIFRLVEISEGSIVIDAVNVKLIYLHELRSRLCVIPQDPFLFEGTARANLDPHGRHQDVDLWDALRKTHLVDVISLLGGLDAVLKRDSISVGQRQLLCLARAVLHSASVICIDEATANVDVETDRLIQETVRTCFRRSTVLTIAHRVRTVLDSDRYFNTREFLF
ncbi:hypothetical protein AAG570_003964 [Ranatra chinensis]|uniref:Multidrug resistance-associated protein 7 n=1 Tax=Ranatra chinensis TaxID=642074 RepID=A0ABD0YKJ4_9HEMI